MTTQPLSGGWLPSVAFHRGECYWGVMREHGPVTIYRMRGEDPPEVVWSDPTATTNAYIRLYSDGTTLWAAYRVDNPEAIQLASTGNGNTWTYERLLPTAGNNPVALGYGYIAQLISGAGPFPLQRRPLVGGAWSNLPPCPGTGIAHLTPSSYVSMDDNRASVPNMLNPMRCDGLTVGEVNETGPRCILSDGRGGILWADSSIEWINPMCASDGQRFAVTAWRPSGEARVSVLTSDEIAVLPTTVTPVPIPVPPPPPEVPPMTLHPDVIALFRRFLTAFPVPNGAPDSAEHYTAMRAWMKRFCEQVRFSFPNGMPGVGGEFGWKRASTGRPESKESLALQTNGGLGAWDLFKGVGTGNPQADFSPDYHDIWNPPEGPQVFIPVTATDHLSNPGTITPPTPGRATVTGPWICVSAFNLLERSPTERDAWLKEFPRGMIHRVLLARSKRVDGRIDISWTPEDGLANLPRVLDVLRAHGQRMHLTINCDTKLYDLSRADVRELTRQVSIAVLPHDTTLADVQLFNEPVHETQQPFCADPAFNAELEALFPLRIPVTWGPTTHGGLVGGSFGTIHGDRSLTPEENAQYAADLKRVYLREFVDDEPKGIDETEQPGRRTNDPDFARRLAQAAKDRGLLGATLHWEAGLTADVTLLGPVHREALKQFLGVFGKIPEVGVTTEQIAQVFAGGWFEQISTLLGLTGSVEARRAEVHAWIAERVEMLNRLYLDVFDRPCDLEGYGSRLWLFIEHGWTEDQMRQALQAAYDRGDR